jgi:hypothetical protein
MSVKQKPNRIDLRWLWLLVPVFLSLFLLPRFFFEFRGAERSSMAPVVRSADQIRVVTVNDQTWRPEGRAETIPSKQMRVAGKSREGFPVYVRVTEGGGGGSSTARLYLHLSDGRYQALQRD